MVKCSVCRKKIKIDKESVYQAQERLSVADAMIKVPRTFDAIDCPICGCQKLLQIREPSVFGGDAVDIGRTEPTE